MHTKQKHKAWFVAVTLMVMVWHPLAWWLDVFEGFSQDAQEHECNNRPTQCLQQKSGLAWFVALTLKVLGMLVGLVDVEPALHEGFLLLAHFNKSREVAARYFHGSGMQRKSSLTKWQKCHRAGCNNRPGQCTHQKESGLVCCIDSLAMTLVWLAFFVGWFAFQLVCKECHSIQITHV